MSELTHTVTLKPNLYMRLFLWFWDAKGQKLNTCLIFWGTLFMLILWPLRLLIALTAALADRWQWGAKLAARRDRKVKHVEPPREAFKVPKERGSLFKLLTKLSHAGALIWFKYQIPITWFLIVLAGGDVLTAFVWAIYGLTTIAWSWMVLWVALLTLGAIGLMLVLLIWIDHLMSKRQPRVKKHTIRRIYRSVHDHTCANVIIED